jgi:hypothetical protein
MALADLKTFIIQCLQQVDNTLDLTPGSPYDTQVIEPILSRVGTDPFTVDIGLFIQTLLNQQFPDMPTKEGDAITDLLIKPAIVLWNPIVREISRVETVQSFADPTTLTTDDAAALGANLFATLNPGNLAVGVVRIYFAQPQSVSVSPSNYVTCQQGLHFFPTEVQSIRVDEMMLNVEQSLYYFDINVIAEAAGDQYNIDVDQVVTIANVQSAQRITNKARFRTGSPAQTAVEFVDNISQSLTERSMVTQRGINAQLTAAFPELTSVNPIGFNDPEMQRDIITGGGLGPIIAAGVALFAEPDGENAPTTRRVKTTELGVDFSSLLGPTQQGVEGFTLTIASPTGTQAFPIGSLPVVRDIGVLAVVDTQTLDLVDEVLLPTATGLVWILRANTISLSNIPGGILFPNTPYGTLQIPPNQIHIGGCTDIYVRANAFDSATLILTSIIDDEPALSGIALVPTSDVTPYTVTLDDYILGTNYSVGDPTWTILENAASNNLTLEILDPPNAGDYRILNVDQSGASPVLTVDQAIAIVVGNERWRISDQIFIDLTEPKDTKISGSDLATVQNIDIVSTISGVDFSDYGVGPGDTLRILTGALILGDYQVVEVLSPLFTHIQVDRELPASVSNAKYTIFRPNAAGGITTPFIRIDSIQLLDTSSQPVGTIIPYAKPIDVQSNGFANSAHGIKFDLVDGTLGIVTKPFLSATVPLLAGKNLTIQWEGQTQFNVTFTGVNPIPLASVVAQINAQSLGVAGVSIAVLMADGTQVGIIPVGPNVQVGVGPSTALPLLFGGLIPVSSRDINSVEVFDDGGWASLRPALDSNFDVAQVVDGLQIGFYFLALSTPADLEEPVPNQPFDITENDPLRTRYDFNPEVSVHIQVGSRSLGTARLYFLDPTSFQVNENALFTLTNTDGSVLNYFPDPSNNYQTIPPLPSGAVPLDGSAAPNTPAFPPDLGTLTSISTDFIAFGIQPGDTLNVTYVPLAGTVSLLDPVVGLNTKILTLSLAGAPNKNIIFIHDSNAIAGTDVTRAGVVTQINNIVGQVICSLDATNHLVFNPNFSVIVRSTGSANSYLGFSTVSDEDNSSLNFGTYQVTAVPTPNTLVVTPSFSHTETNEQFTVSRDGLQRIVSTTMATQQDSSGLYYFDVTLVSQGTGDDYNIGANLQLTVAGYTSDGYYLTTDDSNLTFSPAEKPNLIISNSILEVGVTDSPANATQLSGQNIQINYDQSSLTNDVDSFARSDTERVINDSPLGRHLIPYFVRFALNYTGGSSPTVLIPDIQTFILALEPTQALQVSDMEKLAYNRNAVSVDNPIDLIAVIYNVDRTISVERSQDSLNTGRLAAFFPDVLNVTQSTS